MEKLVSQSIFRDHKGDPSMGRVIALLSALSGLGMAWYVICKSSVSGADAVILILGLVGTATAGKVAGKIIEFRQK